MGNRAVVGWLGGLVIAFAVAFAAVDRHAQDLRRVRGARGPQRLAAVRLLGTADLFLSSSSRWIRHLSLSEPGAAFADGPALLDTDPAAGIVGPPRQLWTGYGGTLSRRGHP